MLIIPIIALIVGFAVFTLIKPAQNNTKSNDKKTSLSLGYPFASLSTKLNTTIDSSFSYSALSTDKLYKVDPFSEFFPSQVLAKSISKNLKLNQLDENTWENKEYNVSFINDDYYIRIILKNASTNEITKTNLLEVSENKLKELKIWPYEGKEFLSETTILEKSNINGTKAAVAFSEKINDQPVYTNLAGNGEVYIEFNANGQITSIKYFYVPYKIESTESIEFKSSEDIKTAVSSGNYQLVGNSTNFSSIKIKKIDYGFFASTESDYAQAVLLTEGENEFFENVKLLVPAFKDSYY